MKHTITRLIALILTLVIFAGGGRADQVTEEEEWIWPDAPKTQQEETPSAEDETEGAEMAKIETYFDCDLKKAVQVQPLNGNVFSLDNNGNRIGVRIFDNGVKTTVTGTVTGRAILADNSTVNLNGGLTTVNGQSVAYVDVPQGALLIPGTIKITIQLTASGVITTLAAILSTVYQTKTDNVITPSAQVIADWNATISSAIQTQDAAIAAETAARIAADSDLKSAFNHRIITNYNIYDYTNPTFHAKLNDDGTLNTTDQDSTNYFVTDFIPCEEYLGKHISVFYDSFAISRCCYYDGNKNFVSQVFNVKGSTGRVIPTGTGIKYLRVSYTIASYDYGVFCIVISDNTLADSDASLANDALFSQIKINDNANTKVFIGKPVPHVGLIDEVIAIGTEASKDTVGSNVAIGRGALKSNTANANTDDGKFNTAIGHNALQNNTTGNHNTAVGWGSGRSTTTGSRNVAVGEDAMLSVTDANDNTCVGNRSYQRGIGGMNTAIGWGAMFDSSVPAADVPSGEGNTAVGWVSGVMKGSGKYNTNIGALALSAENVNFAGSFGYGSMAEKSNQIVIGNNSSGSAKTTEVKLCGDVVVSLPSGNVVKLKFEQDGNVSWELVE